MRTSGLEINIARRRPVLSELFAELIERRRGPSEDNEFGPIVCNLAPCVNYGASRDAMEASVWGGRDFFHCDQNFYLYKEREKGGGARLPALEF